MQNRLWLMSKVVVLLFVASCLCIVWQGQILAQTNKDLVLLVDVSTSMADIFEGVKTEAKEFVETAGRGDRVIVVTLGESAQLLDRRTIKHSEDIEDLKAKIDALEPTDLSSYLSLGLDRALEEMRASFRARPQNQRILLWLSDEKDNPPSWLQDMLTFEELIQKSRQFEAGENWFRYDAPLREVENPLVDAFFRAATLPAFRIYISPADLDLGLLPHDATTATLRLHFDPEVLDSAGATVLVEAELRSRDRPSLRPEVRVSPAAVMVAPSTWEQKLTLSFSASPGPYEGSVLLHAAGAENLSIKPQRIPFKLMVSKPPPALATGTPSVASTYDELTGPRKELALGRAELREAGSGVSTDDARLLVFRGIEPGHDKTLTVILKASQPVDAASIRMVSDLQLPAGLNMFSNIQEQDDGFVAEVTVTASPGLSLAEDWSTTGFVRFECTNPGIVVTPATLRTEVHRASLLLETEPTSVLLSRWLGPYLPRISMAALVIFLLLVIMLLLRSYAPKRKLLTGRLEVVKDPTEGRIKNINLQRASRLRYKATLTVGSSRRCDIVLPHESVAEIHCRILARETEQGAMIYIQPAAYQHVKVNDDVQTGRRQVFDKDLVQVGDFIFVYRSPTPYRETIVQYMDGRSLRGIPITWDIGSPGFRLLLQGADKTSETRYINFTDLKAVYFLQPPGQEAERSRRGWPHAMLKGNEIEVFFRDGESIEGYTLRDYREASKRFFLIPRDPGNAISVLVERQNVESLYMRSTFSQEYPSLLARVTGFFRDLVR